MAAEPRADTGGSASPEYTAPTSWGTPDLAAAIEARARERFIERIADQVAEEIIQDIPRHFITEIVARVRATLAPSRHVNGEASAVTAATPDGTGSNGISIGNGNGQRAASRSEDSLKETGRRRRSTLQVTAPVAGCKREGTGWEDELASPKKKAKAMGGPDSRRNPKRKAAEAETIQALVLPDNPLEEALRPLTADEIAEWEGWAEVESEPAMFNAILEKFGVKDVRARELLSCEPWDLEHLPEPVFGLVFLFQYAPHLEEHDDEEDTKGLDQVWFANQTTSNSCASVALLNIIMNAEDVELGRELQGFKSSTQELDSALRGHRIGSNDFVRTAHNSFVRRMDQLNADLYLAQDVDEAKTKAARKRVGKGKQRKKSKDDVDFGFHFIAYVPAGGYVWELDGMRSRPRKVGPCGAEKWTAIAGPRIQERIRQYGASQNAFNLLAICRSPDTGIRTTIASTLAEIRRLRTAMKDDETFMNLVASEDRENGFDDELDVSEFGLHKLDVVNATRPTSAKDEMSQTGLDSDKAGKRYQELMATLVGAMNSYRQEVCSRADEEKLVAGRSKDYTPALHRWVTKLAEKGVLEDIIKASK
ncbi:Ubiquitin carboxyl-terminal hydrolase isozyme L5 [Purpureocillium lavendulum]|uniref:Ubiquitin carboxyl-terminal hydrolase n=1 Tax=Purpureocillium lavendulum TaxID=1247861 RepID=A0AB34FNF2_9HYPO|nr:Ubiquitin carboxyl-terminal hydrolase isozyme L5 [Purpureocillium lavendulum]